MQKQIIVEQKKYPSYRLTPWEEDQVVEYAKESRPQFAWQKDERTAQTKLLNARLGRGGEIAFTSMFPPEKQAMIIDNPYERKEYSSPYDFKIKGGDKTYTVDVKTTIKSEKVPTPEKCNFVWSLKRKFIKEKSNIDLCDIYVQMFYDPDEFIYYFTGAISLDKINSIHGGVHIPGKSYSLIRQGEMDYTDLFKGYMAPIVKI